MNRYVYRGPVKEFDTIIRDRWEASTLAVSEKKARSNLIHQYKKETHRDVTAKITLPGKLILIGGES